jgi:hypothetical protein
MEAWMLTMELWSVFRPVDADSHHFDEGPVLIRIQVKKSDPVPHQIDKPYPQFSIHPNVMRIRNNGLPF